MESSIGISVKQTNCCQRSRVLAIRQSSTKKLSPIWVTIKAKKHIRNLLNAKKNHFMNTLTPSKMITSSRLRMVETYQGPE